MRYSVLALSLVLTVGCADRNPKLISVAPKSLCANVESELTLTGSDLDPQRVEIGGGDMGAAMLSASVSGTGATAKAKFAANTLTPSDTPYDVVYVDKNNKRITLPGAVTVVPGISLAAVDPASVYNGVDFPTSVYGTGMGGVTSISISANGMSTELISVVAIDNNRADGVVPAGLAAGVYDVLVTDEHGCTATLAGALTVVADLTVSVCAIDPTFGFTMEDTDVTITATADGTPGGAACGGKTAKFASSPRAWLSVGGVLKALRNVGFVSAGALTATIPSGLTVGGPYDVIIQNPDGSIGLLAGAFTVVSLAVPRISSVDPPTVPTNFGGTIKIFGQNFRAPVKVEMYSKTIAAVTVPNPTVTNANEISVPFNPTSLGLDLGAFVVRVTNTDQMTFGEYSALGIIRASNNLPPWTDVTAATPMPNATMRHGAAAGQVSPAAHYLYVMGGDSGGATPTRYDVTQIASLDKFGNIGSWFVGHNKLPAARTQLGAISIPNTSGSGGYVYAVGGNTATATDTAVVRAKILLPSEAPNITQANVSLNGTLARGTWYYQVSAVLDATNLTNPLGETLPSEEFVAHTVDNSKVSLTWDAVPMAATYRVYRTAIVNGISKSEVLLKDAVTGTNFLDDGSGTTGTATPLVPGELGVWVPVSSLMIARRSLGVATAHDAAGAQFLYAIGGDAGTAAAVTAGELSAGYEYATLSADGATLGPWTHVAAPLKYVARTRLQSPVGEHATSPAVPLADSYVYAVGGWNGTAVVATYQAGKVGSGGALTWNDAPYTSAPKIMQGLASIIASDQLFVMGGTNATDVPQTTSGSNVYGDGASNVPDFGTALTNDPLDRDTLGATVASFATLTFTTAHFYLLGGITAKDGPALKRVWSIAY